MALTALDRTSRVAGDKILIRDVSAPFDKKSTITNEELMTPIVVVNPDTTHAIPIANGVVVMTKGSASAFTLAAPAATTQDGTRMTFLNGSAFAHVITATGLIHDGVTGGAKNTATFGAFLGASLTLVAYNTKWYVESKNVCTIA